MKLHVHYLGPHKMYFIRVKRLYGWMIRFNRLFAVASRKIEIAFIDEQLDRWLHLQ